jgi:hypothetical protein
VPRASFRLYPTRSPGLDRLKPRSSCMATRPRRATPVRRRCRAHPVQHQRRDDQDARRGRRSPKRASFAEALVGCLALRFREHASRAPGPTHVQRTSKGRWVTDRERDALADSGRAPRNDERQSPRPRPSPPRSTSSTPPERDLDTRNRSPICRHSKAHAGPSDAPANRALRV